MRTTVDTFISEYMAAIEDRNSRIKTFNQMTSHELRSPIGTLMFAAAVLERSDIDVVCVCVPSGLHAAVGAQAAEAGKHVVVEKPIDV